MGRHVTSYEIAITEYQDLRKQYTDAMESRLDALQKAIKGETCTAAYETADRLRKYVDGMRACGTEESLAKYMDDTPAPDLGAILDDEEIAEIRGRMELALTKAEIAFDAYERLIVHGIRDPNGYDLPTPPPDPNAPPPMDLGNFYVAEKGARIEIHGGKIVRHEGDGLTKLTMPNMKKAVDLNDAATAAQLNHLHGWKR